MSNSFTSPLPTFTLESLVDTGRWTAAQNSNRKKAVSKTEREKKTAEHPSNSNKLLKDA